MRRFVTLFLTTSALAGGALALAVAAGAQDASGPRTSGGSLPYISGKEPAESPDAGKGGSAAKTQATSGSAPAAAAPPPQQSGKDVRVIDMSKENEKPAAPETKPVTARPEPKPEPAPTEAARREPPPGPQRAEDETAATPPPETSKPAEAKAPAKSERKTTRSTTSSRRQTETVRRSEPSPSRSARSEGYERRAAPPRPYEDDDRYGRYAERTPPQVDRRSGYAEEDEDGVYIYRPRRWREVYPYGYPYYRQPPGFLRPFEAPPRVYARPSLPNGGNNCHFHAYPSGMGFHREIRCHWHQDAYDPSLRYVR